MGGTGYEAHGTGVAVEAGGILEADRLAEVRAVVVVSYRWWSRRQLRHLCAGAIADGDAPMLRISETYIRN